jgi:hypothetical protein
MAEVSTMSPCPTPDQVGDLRKGFAVPGAERDGVRYTHCPVSSALKSVDPDRGSQIHPEAHALTTGTERKRFTINAKNG